MDEFFLEGIVHFGTQPTDNNIDNVRVGVEIDAPNMFGDLLTGDDLPSRAGELAQEQKFLGSEGQRYAVTGCAMPAGVDRQIFNAQLFGASGRAPAQQRTDAREQFGKRERLYQIIIRPELESLDAITHTVARGEKKNRCPEPGFAKFLDQRPSVFLWKHYIDNQQVELTTARQFKPTRAIIAGLDTESCFAKSLGEKPRGLFLIFDDQNTHRPTYNTKRPLPEKLPFANATTMARSVLFSSVGAKSQDAALGQWRASHEQTCFASWEAKSPPLAVDSQLSFHLSLFL